MKAPKAFWIGMILALGGCTQLLELDQEYRPGQTSSSSGEAGSGAMGGAAGSGGAGGSSECVADTDCISSLDPCAVAKCIANLCVMENQPAGTVLMMQTLHDCQDAICDGSGTTTMQTNDADLPEDNNICTKNVCKNGVPSHPPEPLDTICGVKSKCNGMGLCIGCVVPADCAGTDDFCKTRICNGGTCGYAFTAMGTDLPTGQTAGNCRALVCDGQGNTVNNPNDTDLPMDGNPCTKDVCTVGVPSNPAEPSNTPCGTDSVCNGSGACKKSDGTTCTGAGDCLSGYCVEGYCCNSACTQTCRACNISGSLGVCTVVPVGYSDDSCPSPQSCDGTTGAGSCVNKFPIGYACTLSSQCSNGLCVDGRCCSTACTGTCQSCNVAGSAGTCTNIPSGQEDGALCSGANSCDGLGNCKKDNGQTCATNAECVSSSCVDGVCCNTSCLGTCQACDVTGSVGSCSNVPSGQEDPVATTACTGVNSCNGSGLCLLDDGQPCMNNAECVSNDCGGVCQQP